MRRSCSLLALALAPSVMAQSPSPPERVVLTGTASPAGGTFSNLYVPVLSNSGTIAFRSDLSGAGGTATTGLFAASGGAIQSVAVRGSVSPAGGTYTNSPVPTNITLAGDRVMFRMGTTVGGGSAGVFAGPVGGPIQTVALNNTATPNGGVFLNLASAAPLATNAAGRVAFEAGTGSGTFAVFAGVPGGLLTLAATDGAAPAGAAGTYSTFSEPRINGSGQVAFGANLRQANGSTQSGLFLASAAGDVRTVAAVGTAVPGGTVSTFAAAPAAFAVNDAGQVAVRLNVDRGTSNSASVFVGLPGALQEVARAGAAAPGGGTYSSVQAPLLNAAGQVAFAAGLRQVDGTGTIYTGLIVGDAAGSQLVARTGAAAPAGGTFSGIGEHTLNARGQVAFVGTLTGLGISTANNEALYAGTPDLLLKVVQKGDVIDADPGAGTDLRTVSNVTFVSGLVGQDGPAAFADDGRIAYLLTFSNGTEGIFTSVVPVPEPAGLLAVAAAGLLALRRRTATP